MWLWNGLKKKIWGDDNSGENQQEHASADAGISAAEKVVVVV